MEISTDGTEEIVKREVDEKVYLEGEFEGELTKAAGSSDTFEAIVSTGVLDRQGEKINIDGVDIKRYKENPVVLWGHDYQGLPIGKAITIRKSAGQIISKFQLAIKENPFAQTVSDLISGGYIGAVSIGVMVKEWSPDYTEILKSEMVEFSIVPVPANQEAMIMRGLKAIGKTKEEFVQEYKESVAKTLAGKSNADEISNHISNLKDLVALLEDTHKVSQNEVAPEKVKVIRKITLKKTAGQLVKEAEKTVRTLKISLKESEVK